MQHEDYRRTYDIGQSAHPVQAVAAEAAVVAHELHYAAEASGWGWLPALSLTVAFGLLAVAFANAAAGQGNSYATPLFWIGLLVMFLPSALRLASAGPARGERIGLSLMLALGLYLVKVIRSPLAFTSYDELLHWRTATDILQTGHLFNHNPLLPVSPFYPGLENVTTALVQVSGLSLFSAGVIVVAAARALTILALFVLYEQASGSARLAGIGAMIYMTNLGFIYFDAVFAYESLALPLAICAMGALALARAAPRAGRAVWPWRAALVLLLAAVVVTHHVTSYALLAYLGLWSLTTLASRQERGVRPRPILVTLLFAVMVSVYLALVAPQTLDYLRNNLDALVFGLLRLISGESAGRQLFSNATGLPAPLWEQLAGYSSTLLILAGLPVGWWHLWRHWRGRALAIAFGLASAAYPATLAMRFVPNASDIPARAVEFLSIALAFVLAIGALGLRSLRLPALARTVLAAVGALILFVGGVVLGTTAWGRLPGPYLVSADPRSIELEGLSAAEWARVYIQPNDGIVADRINGLLMASYGQQRVVTDAFDGVNAPSLFFAARWGTEEMDVLNAGQIRYLVVDRRLTRALPFDGIYYELGEPDTGRRRKPLDPALLGKFDAMPGVSRQFDSGDIQIYNVGGLLRAR